MPRFDILRRAFGRGVFPHQMSWVLNLPGRGLIMPATTVAARLPVSPDAHVLEVGPGSGYYSVEAARRIPQGQLTLLDIQPEMLVRCERALCEAGIEHVRTVQASASGLPFQDACFDAVFLVTVFGEIADQESFCAEAYRVLKPGGVLSITEHHPDPDFEPPAAVRAALQRQGFEPGEVLGWRWAFTLNGVKPGRSRETTPRAGP